MFSVVVENEKSKFNLTEKLLEPLLNRCIPIYWGAKIQRDLFDQNGIIEFETLDELKDILKSINESDYKSRASAIEKNFVLSQTLISKEMNIIAAIQNSRLIPNFVCPDYFPTVIPENPIESHRTVTHNPARNDINKFVCLKVALEKFLYFSVKLVLIKKRITW
jgi:hypothetical protein